MPEQDSPDATRARAQGLITGAWSTQVVFTAARLKVFDRLAEGPRLAADLAAETGSNPEALLRLLRALASLELVRHLDGDRFELAPAGRLLVEGAPGGVRGMALHWGQRLWAALGQLGESVRTGEPFQASGLGGFEGIASDPAQTAMFHQSMADQTGPVAAAMLQAYDFARFRTLVDVGGGYGALLAAILKANPDQTGEVFDLPGLAAASGAYLQGAGVADRARFTGGSFFETVPPGADAYMLKMIIHDWRDEQALPILQNCARAAGRDGVVLVIERIAPERAGPDPADQITLRSDILMLTAAGGLERTQGQYRTLFEAAGLQMRRITPTAAGSAILEAVALL